MAKKLENKALYRLRFLDHCTGEDDGCLIDFVGFYINEDKDFFVFSSWLLDSNDEEMVTANLEKVFVIKTAIKYLKKIPNRGLLQ